MTYVRTYDIYINSVHIFGDLLAECNEIKLRLILITYLSNMKINVISRAELLTESRCLTLNFHLDIPTY